MLSWPSCFVQIAGAAAVHIVVIAWLYVIGTMALTSSTLVGGLAFFAGAGVAPVLLWLMWAARRARARRRPPRSGLEQHVRGGDDSDTEPDERQLADRLERFGAPMQARNEVGDGDVQQAGGGDREHER